MEDFLFLLIPQEEMSPELKNSVNARQMEDKKMRSYAVIPPLLLDTKQRRIAYQNRNGLLQAEELEALHNERKLINVWSPMEHELFKEKYLQHPKNFGVVAQSLEHKSAQDCVLHYYLTKTAENYKRLLRKSRQRTRSRNNPNNKVNNSSSGIGSIDILTTGVTTRLQREQQQKTQENPQNSSTTATSSTSTTTVTTATSGILTSTTATTLSVSMTTEATTTSTTATTTLPSAVVTTSVVTSPSISSTKDTREANKENKENKGDSKESLLIKDNKEGSPSSSEAASGKDNKTSAEGKSTLLSINTSTGATSMQTDSKEKKKGNVIGGGASSSRVKDKKKENHATPMETSDEEAQSIETIESGRQIGPHTCTVCQNMVEGGGHSRALSRSQASQYGLREDQIAPGARVCNTCRCKAVRGRYTACPLPGCPNLNNASSKTRVKRLRALPPKWFDLPPEIRDPVMQEFQISNNVTKCCSACFNRISRRLAPHLSGASETLEDTDASTRQWTDEELEQLRRMLREHGTNWPKVSEQIPGKTNHQCKNYYLTYRKKLGLDQAVAEYYQTLGEERRPCLTDEEESGSSTSSCDELAVHDSSDTASAGSPANTISSSTPIAAVTNATLSMPLQQSTDSKLGDKLSDIAVVSLVPPSVSIVTPQQPSAGGGLPSSNREDYDSSATETADEGQGGTDLDTTSVVVTLTNANDTNGIQQQQQQQQ